MNLAIVRMDIELFLSIGFRMTGGTDDDNKRWDSVSDQIPTGCNDGIDLVTKPSTKDAEIQGAAVQ